MAGSNFSHPWKYFMYKLCNCLPWEYTEILLGIDVETAGPKVQRFLLVKTVLLSLLLSFALRNS